MSALPDVVTSCFRWPAAHCPVGLSLALAVVTAWIAPSAALAAVPLAAPATPAALADAPTPTAVDLPQLATTPQFDWPNPSAPPAWIQWLGWAPDGKRIAWRQGPEWAVLLPGTPIEIARLDEQGRPQDVLHQRENPAGALKFRKIRSTEPLYVERRTERDVLLRAANGRIFAVVVRPGRASVAAILEKKRRSYQPIARWLVRGPADRVDVMAFEDLAHRLLALVIHTDRGPLRQAQLAVLPLSTKVPVHVSALTLPEAATATSLRRP